MLKMEDYLSRFFGDAKDLTEFLLLLKSLHEEEASQLITELIDGAKINLTDLCFSEQAGHRIGQNLISVDGFGYGTQRLFHDGAFHESEKTIPLVKIMDEQGRFAFCGQPFDGESKYHLILAEVAPEFRQQGLFQQLFKAICWYAFQELSATSVCGRAAIPRLSLFNDSEPSADDWRMKPKTLWGELNQPPFRATNLLHLWLGQKNCYPRAAVDEFAASDEFFIAKPEHLQCLSPSERQKLEDSYPKSRRYWPFQMHFKSVLNY